VDPDDTCLLDNVVRFVGQRVVAVVAESEGTAEEACRLVQIDYEVLPAVFDPEEAMKDGAPVIHTGLRAESRIEDAEHNVFLRIANEVGNVDEGFAEADAISEGTYYSTKVQHAHLETHGSIVWQGDDGRYHVRTSTQTPHLTKNKLAYLFGLFPHQIHVFSERVGGGFGAKQEVLTEDLCLFAAIQTCRPVKWEFTRAEEFSASVSRHPMKVTIKLGARKDGTLTAMEIRTVSDTGALARGKLNVARKAYGTPRSTAFLVHGFRVAVHGVTGEIRILQSVQAYDAGTVLNPMQARGQLEGGIAQGIGICLFERMVFDEKGVLTNPNFRNYLIPAFVDIPRSEIYFAKTHDAFGPMGAKPVGEAPIIPIAGALGNAVADATGVRLTSLPFSADRIYAEIASAG